MENPCWVEGVGAISCPSGTLSYWFLFFYAFPLTARTCTYTYPLSLAKGSATLGIVAATLLNMVIQA